MDVVYTHRAGLDVHKKMVAVCCVIPGPKGENLTERRSFSTMTRDLLTLSDWLATKGVTHVAMESTGEYWKPAHNILESRFVVVLANATQVQTMPGNKTDTKDAAWLAELLRFGLIRGSFVPPLPQRDLRDLTRQRADLVQSRTAVVNQLQKALEWANIKLAGVASSVTGVSARSMLEAILSGRSEPAELADLAKGRLKKKRAELEKALDGRVREHRRFMIANHLVHLDFLDEQISVFDEAIVRTIEVETERTAEMPAEGPTVDSSQTGGKRPPSWAEAVQLLDTIPKRQERAPKCFWRRSASIGPSSPVRHTWPVGARSVPETTRAQVSTTPERSDKETPDYEPAWCRSPMPQSRSRTPISGRCTATWLGGSALRRPSSRSHTASFGQPTSCF